MLIFVYNLNLVHPIRFAAWAEVSIIHSFNCIFSGHIGNLRRTQRLWNANSYTPAGLCVCVRVLWGFLSSCVRFRISFMNSCGSYTHAHTRLVAVSTFPSPLSGAWRHAVIPSVWFSPGNLIMTHTSLAACGKTSWKHLGWSCQLFNYLVGEVRRR